MFYNTKNGVPFEVYLTEDQLVQFRDFAQRELGKAMLIFSRISTRQSTCWVLNDQLRIHSIIESSVGFEAVDRQVHEAIAAALKVVPTSSQQLQSQTSSGKQLSMTFDTAESLLSWFQGRDIADKKAEKIEVTLHWK